MIFFQIILLATVEPHKIVGKMQLLLVLIFCLFKKQFYHKTMIQQSYLTHRRQKEKYVYLCHYVQPLYDGANV